MSYKLNRVYVEIGNLCNLSCAFCPGTKRVPKQMSPSEFRSICEKLRPHTDYIYLHVMGEPLLHPELGSLLQIAEDFGFRVCVTTNGTLLSSCGAVLLEHAATVHKVSVSLHSMEGNGAELEQDGYLTHAIDFARVASACGIYTVFRLWNLDADGKRGQNLENGAIENMLRIAFPEEWIKRWNGFRLQKNVFLEYAGIFTWPTESTADDVEDGYCHGLTDQLAVLADGTVVPCCLDSEGEIALGNLFSSTLEEILGLSRAAEMRKGLASGKFVEPLCKKCTYARRFKR